MDELITKASPLPEDSETNPWVAAFICEIYSIFGVPVAAEACTSKTDKLQYIWSRIGISNALALEEPMWRAMVNRVEPHLAADEFVRRYYRSRKRMVIEEIPNFVPRAVAPKALTNEITGTS